MDEPTGLPEGTELDLFAMDDSDEFNAAERAELSEAIEAGAADIEQGQFVDGLIFAQQLLSKREAQTR